MSADSENQGRRGGGTGLKTRGTGCARLRSVRWSTPDARRRCSLLILSCLLLFVACGRSHDESRLDVAIDVAKWLRASMVSSPQGPIWPDDALRPGKISTDLGSGVAGTVLFYLALADVSGDSTYLVDAGLGADYLLATLPTSPPDVEAIPKVTGLYGGLAGVGFALNEAFKATGDTRYRRGALRCVERLHTLARRDGRGVTWNGCHDIMSGNAGTGLFLLYAAQEMRHTPSRPLAERAGNYLIDHTVVDTAGWIWEIGTGMEMVLPNFSHGNAGIGYFLGRLYQENGKSEYVHAAIGAARYLQAVAATGGNAFLVPYGVPNDGYVRPYDVGWAHGPAGTARLFQLLWQVTRGAVEWENLVAACARGVVTSGLPGDPAAVFGVEPFGIDMRFGSAGAAMFMLDLYQERGEPADLAFAKTVLDDIVAQATRDDRGTRWVLPRFGFMEHEGEPAEFTGYFYGAAGFGLALLRLHVAEQGERWTTVFPDNPFTPVRRK